MSETAPLRILLVGDYPDDPRLGSAKVMHELRKAFVALGHECDAVFSPEIGNGGPPRLHQAIAPLKAMGAIRRRLSNGGFDVVDAASAEGLWFGLARRIGAYRRTAYICRSHGLEHLNYQRMLDDDAARLISKPWWKRLWYPAARLSQVALAARLSDGLVVLNERDWSYTLSRSWQVPDRVTVIPHGLSEQFLGNGAAPFGSRGSGVLFCGTWDHSKGIQYLVRAIDLLAERGETCPLTVLGPGIPAADVLAAFTDRARPTVTVIDRADVSRVREEYRRHDVLVFPSTYEGFGLTVIEAMSQGLPVIATPVGCAATLVRTGETGVQVPPRDATAIADAIAVLMKSREERRQLGENAAREVASMSWAETARKTVEFYRRALERIRGSQEGRTSA